jgi:hypothetical protein
MDRLPISRQIALAAADREAARVFQKPVALKEIFSSASSRRGTENRLIAIHIGDIIPLKSRDIAEWPKTTSALCLHCSEKIDHPLPAVKYHDTHDDKYWVYGYFCRPCCSLAYVQEQPGDFSRCLAWTQQVLRNYFGVKDMSAAPPRCALKKFGGSMSLSEFYGESNTFVAMHAPPFVTFAMYAEVAKKPIDSGIKRPTTRTDPVAVNESTGKVPLILEFLAARGAVRTRSEEPKRRKTKATGTLTQYFVKN